MNLFLGTNNDSTKLANCVKQFLPLIFCSILIISCASHDNSIRKSDTLIGAGSVNNSGSVSGSNLPYVGVHPTVQVPTTPKLPWLVWSFGRDLNGDPLQQIDLLQGDELWKRDRFQDALARYKAVPLMSVPNALQDAVVIRIAGAELALGQPEAALRTVSSYFQRMGKNENDVDTSFCLLFGYAYGSRGDVDQSLAWFSRAYRGQFGAGSYKQSAEDGVRALIRLPNTPELLRLSERWRSDHFISALIGQEQRNRSMAGYQELVGVKFAEFWNIPSYTTASLNPNTGAMASGVVGVILPLSGQYSALGRNIKGGIELAVLGQQAENQFNFQYRDSVGDPFRAVGAFRELQTTVQPSVVIGPLLSEEALEVANVARQNSTALLTFPKRSGFLTGQGVFRLGATLESQLESLLDAVASNKQMTKLAIVASDDQNGQIYTEVFKNYASQRGFQILGEVRYRAGYDGDLVTAAAKTESLEVDGIFFPGSLREASRFVSNLSPAKRAAAPLLGLGVWDNPRELEQSRAVMDGAIFVSPFFTRSSRPVVQQFIESYRKKFGTSPDFLAAQGFDSATLVIAALRRGHSAGLSFQQALESVDTYEGLTGNIYVKPGGEIGRIFQVVEISRGTIQPLINSGARASLNPSYIVRGEDVVDAPYPKRLEHNFTNNYKSAPVYTVN